jgi:hypothetical protein
MTLRSELPQLDTVIQDVLDAEQRNLPAKSRQALAVRLRPIQSICAALLQKWEHELFSSPKEVTMTRYVRFHQCGISRLSNRISELSDSLPKPSPAKQSLSQPCEAILKELEKLLYFLEGQCYPYFDHDYPITIFRCAEQCAAWTALINPFKEYANGLVEDSLIELIARSFQEICEEGMHSPLSYRECTILQHMISLADRLLKNRHNLTTAMVAKALIRQNFNTLLFFNWYKEQLNRQIENARTEKEEQQLLRDEILFISETFVDPAKAIEPKLPNIDTAILSWLQEKATNNKALTDTLQSEQPQKLAINLSVPQLAIFARIFVQAGCFSESNMARINRFFVQHFSTKKQSDVSVKSFTKAFYNADQIAAAVVRHHLQKMLNYVNKTYFP